VSKSANVIRMRNIVHSKLAFKPIRKFLEMEQRWLMLARSYEFTERLEDLSNETKRQADKLPKNT